MKTGLTRFALGLAALAVLAAVFLAYLDPHNVRDLADRIWACFG